jgi:hypothetical protein
VAKAPGAADLNGARRIACALWALAALLTVGALTWIVLYQIQIDDPRSQTFSEAVGTVTSFGFPTIGAVILTRRPGNRIGWLLIIAGLSLQLESFTGAYAALGLATATPIALPGAAGVAVIADALWLPSVTLAFVYFVLLFPNGQLLSPRWRAVLVTATVASVAWSLVTLIDPGPLYFAPGVLNPFGVPRAGTLIAFVQGASLLIMGVLVIAALVCIIVRVRRSRGDERHQLKWFVYAAALTVCTIPIAIAFNDSPFGALPLELATAGLPIAIGISILRYRLYDIDRIISRTVAYGVLTAILAGAYLAVILVLQSFVPVDDDSPLLVAISTLTVVGAFGPMRARVKGVVDRRFNRTHYDAERTIEAFGRRLRDEVELESLSRDLTGVIERTMHPRHVSVWLKPGDLQ